MYFNGDEGIVIVTVIVESKDIIESELVESIAFQPKSIAASKNANVNNNQTSINWGKPLTDKEIKYEVDYLYMRLAQVPNAKGFIIDYGTDKEVAKRKAKILKFIKYRAYPLNKIEFIRGSKERGIRTEFEVSPDGNAPLTSN